MGGLYHEDRTDSRIPLIRAARMPRAMAYAEAVFETFRVLNGRVFALEAHIARMRKGLAAFGFAPSWMAVRQVFGDAVCEAGKQGEDTLVRLTLGGGDAERGLGERAPLVGWLQIDAPPASVAPARLHRFVLRGGMPTRTAKFPGDYAWFLRRWHQAGRPHAPESLLLVNGRGRVLGGTVANVLIFRKGCWFTPRAGAGVLPGVVRGFLVREGLVKPCACPAAWLDDCDAMALTNSGAFIRPVAVLDGRTLAVGVEAFDPLWTALRGQPGVPR
ncbi:MAG: aminotransferase class IV [Mariprofundaceae bacterium]